MCDTSKEKKPEIYYKMFAISNWKALIKIGITFDKVPMNHTESNVEKVMHYAYTTNSNPRFSGNAHGLPIFRKL